MSMIFFPVLMRQGGRGSEQYELFRTKNPCTIILLGGVCKDVLCVCISPFCVRPDGLELMQFYSWFPSGTRKQAFYLKQNLHSFKFQIRPLPSPVPQPPPTL